MLYFFLSRFYFWFTYTFLVSLFTIIISLLDCSIVILSKLKLVHIYDSRLSLECFLRLLLSVLYVRLCVMSNVSQLQYSSLFCLPNFFLSCLDISFVTRLDGSICIFKKLPFPYVVSYLLHVYFCQALCQRGQFLKSCSAGSSTIYQF